MKIIKRIAILAITVVIAIMLGGCEKKQEQKNEEKNNVNEVQNTTNEVQPTENKTMTVNKNNVVSVIHENKTTSDSESYMILSGYDKNNNKVWIYKTETGPLTELETVEYLGEKANNVYINVSGTIISLDKQTGKELWKNSDYKGASTKFQITPEGDIFLCGYYGPDLCVISKSGKTLKIIKEFDSQEYFWPCEMKFIDENTISIQFEGGKGGEIRVNTKNYNFTKVE